MLTRNAWIFLRLTKSCWRRRVFSGASYSCSFTSQERRVKSLPESTPRLPESMPKPACCGQKVANRRNSTKRRSGYGKKSQATPVKLAQHRWAEFIILSGNAINSSIGQPTQSRLGKKPPKRAAREGKPPPFD